MRSAVSLRMKGSSQSRRSDHACFARSARACRADADTIADRPARWRRVSSPHARSSAEPSSVGSVEPVPVRRSVTGGEHGSSCVAALLDEPGPPSRLASPSRCWRNRGCKGVSSAATGSRTWCAASSEPILRRRPRASPCGSAAPGRPSAARTRVTSSRRGGRRAALSPTGRPAADRPRLRDRRRPAPRRAGHSIRTNRGAYAGGAPRAQRPPRRSRGARSHR